MKLCVYCGCESCDVQFCVLCGNTGQISVFTNFPAGPSAPPRIPITGDVARDVMLTLGAMRHRAVEDMVEVCRLIAMRSPRTQAALDQSESGARHASH